MSRSKQIAWVIAAVSFVALIAGGWTLAQRVHAYNAANPRAAPYFLRLDTTDFVYRDRPVHITNEVDQRGKGVVRVSYGDDAATIPVGVPNPYDLPGLARHEDWLRVLFIGEPSGRTFEEFTSAVKAGEIQPRLVFVSRHLNPGVDNSLLGLQVEKNRDVGETMRSRWTFGFLELLPEGGFRHWARTYPESERAYAGRVQAAAIAGKPRPERDPDELKEDTWEWYAALQVIPEGKAPNRTFRNDALTAAGWALPVTSSGILGLMFGLAWALAPSRSKRWREKAAAAEAEEG